MLRKIYIYRLVIAGFLLLGFSFHSNAQDTLRTPTPVKDTGQVIHLLNADKLLGIQAKPGDSAGGMQKLIGHVRLQQGGTIFTCDSALQYLASNTIDAYGHIHINQADTINTYSDFLHYEGNTKIATLKNNVKLTDGHMVLTTNYLSYDMNTHIGSYTDGGKLVNQETVLTSKRGYYYADTKDVFFKNTVKLNNPEYTLTTDTLLYNTRTHIATFLAPTAINTGNTIIYTSCGFYNTDKQYTHLCSHPSIVDSTGTLSADTLKFNKANGIGKAFSHVTWSDTSGQVTVQSDYAISNRDKKTIIATKNPLLILAQKSDSLFVASDTLFSGPVFPVDTAKADNTQPDTLSYVYIKPNNPVAKNYQDSLASTHQASTQSNPPDSATAQKTPVTITVIRPDYTSDSLVPTRISLLPPQPSKTKKAAADSARSTKTLKGRGESITSTDRSTAAPKRDSSRLRNVIAYHHVRLYSDSLQGLADSLYYSDVDSAFHFYGNPVLWTGQTQLIGDTIVLITKNQQASRLLLQQHAMIINKVGPDQYNQIKGNVITGYFNDSSQLQWMQVEGNAECIYYAQEDNGAFVGVNHTTASSIRLYFKENHLNKVVFYKKVSGTFKNPVGLKKEDTKLPAFKWEAEKRPQSKDDLRLKNIKHDSRLPDRKKIKANRSKTKDL